MSYKNFIVDSLREIDKNESIRINLRKVRNLFIELPPRNSELLFHSYNYSYPYLFFKFIAKNKIYTSKVSLEGIPEYDISSISNNLWERIVLIVGMSLVPYHFLLADFKTVRIAWASLNEQAIIFYQNYYRKGVAEFRYRQGLNPLRSIQVESEKGKDNIVEMENLESEEKILMLNGGGKDTAIMYELLKDTGLRLSWLNIGIRETQKKIMDISGIQDSINLDFSIDPTIRKDSVYPWGHFPYSAVLMSLALIPAIIYRCRYVTTGNEYSSSFSNIVYRGMEINHKYSGSYEFENCFNEFIHNFLSKNITYFSPLRPFYDIQIAHLLSFHKKYFYSFVSCNRFDGDKWCNDCPKCAYTYLALSAFIDRDKLIKIFGDDLFNNKRTRFWIRNLMTSRVKPWECVGTKEECKLAASLYFEKNGKDQEDFSEPPFWAEIKKAYQDLDVEQAKNKYLVGLREQHNIPDNVIRSIEKKYRNFPTNI